MKKVDIEQFHDRGNFATILKCLLAKKGITQGDMALGLGLSQTTVSSYINGKHKPSKKTLLKIAEYFEVSPDVFFENADEYTPYLNMAVRRFSATLYGLIKGRNMSCEQVAKEIGISRQTISNYINGRQMPTSAYAKRIADYFGVSIDSLINNSEEPVDMRLFVTKLPETPEECIFCTGTIESELPGFEKFSCRLHSEECRMKDGICPYIEKQR